LRASAFSSIFSLHSTLPPIVSNPLKSHFMRFSSQTLHRYFQVSFVSSSLTLLTLFRQVRPFFNPLQAHSSGPRGTACALFPVRRPRSPNQGSDCSDLPFRQLLVRRLSHGPRVRLRGRSHGSALQHGRLRVQRPRDLLPCIREQWEQYGGSGFRCGLR
jgi:hypothetical protein